MTVLKQLQKPLHEHVSQNNDETYEFIGPPLALIHLNNLIQYQQ